MLELRLEIGQLRSAASRFRRRAEIRRGFDDVVAGWDQPAFAAALREYWDPFATLTAPKYLDVQHWVSRAVAHYLSHGLFPDDRPRRVLDVGSGMGYFPAVCQHFGHDVTAIDLDDEALYNRSVEVLGVNRIVHRVLPDDAFPELGERFDVITAFQACFNLVDDGAWTTAEWGRFTKQLVELLNPGGVAHIQFNLDQASGTLYPAGLPKVFESESRLQVHFSKDFVRLTRRES